MGLPAGHREGVLREDLADGETTDRARELRSEHNRGTWALHEPEDDQKHQKVNTQVRATVGPSALVAADP